MVMLPEDVGTTAEKVRCMLSGSIRFVEPPRKDEEKDVVFIEDGLECLGT